MLRKIAIAGVQMYVHPQDLELNLNNMESSLKFIAHSYPFVDLVLFSELALYGAPYPHWRRDAITIPGEWIDRLCQLAKKYQKWLVPGSFYEKEGNKIYNTAVVISPGGKMVARYRKMFPWQPLEKTNPGEAFCVFDIPRIGRLGLCICYDMWFPEVCRTLAWMGAEAVLHPTMTSTNDREQELIISRANAIFNQFYFVDINGTGFGGNGRSLIVDPHGRVLQTVGTEPSILVEILDLEMVQTARRYGVANVSQVLKQFVQLAPAFPVYEQGIKKGDGFKNLGKVTIQKKKVRD